MKDKIVELDAHCVFSEPQFQPKIVFTVAEGTQANTGILDPLGASIADGPELYFTLIRDMAINLQECLSKRGYQNCPEIILARTRIEGEGG